MKSSAKPGKMIQAAHNSAKERPHGADPKDSRPPQRAELLWPFGRSSDEVRLRMYTEEEVAVIIQVSLSQLRKWRMKGNPRRVDGPRFKKIGRMVRYPANALDDYINCENEG